MEIVIALETKLISTCWITTYASTAAVPAMNPRQAILVHRGNSPRKKTLKKGGILVNRRGMHVKNGIAEQRRTAARAPRPQHFRIPKTKVTRVAGAARFRR